MHKLLTFNLLIIVLLHYFPTKENYIFTMYELKYCAMKLSIMIYEAY